MSSELFIPLILLAFVLIVYLCSKRDQKKEEAARAELAGVSKALREYAQYRFSALDLDGDGILLEKDLEGALAKLTGAADQRYIPLLIKHFERIAHVTRTIAISGLAGTGPMITPYYHRVPIFGIDRSDIETLPERLAA